MQLWWINNKTKKINPVTQVRMFFDMFYLWSPIWCILGYAEISSDFETYIQLSTYCIQATGKTYIEFSIKALTDVHVALMTQDLPTPRDDWSQFYEIVIGVWSNQKSCIRALKEYCAYIESPGILNSAGYVQLWISWDNGDIQLGKGPKGDGVVVVSHPQIIPYDVNYLAVMTHYPSLWRFYEGGLRRVVYVFKIILIHSILNKVLMIWLNNRAIFWTHY